jgi:caffeoyl-CoA O-methyltransferase
MNVINDTVEKYAAQFTSVQDDILQRVEDETLKNHAHAHMISGRVQGVLLQMLSEMMQPRRILEIGTFTGFSSLCLAKGLQPDGQLHTIEIRETDAAIAKKYFEQTSAANKIKLHVGNAKEIIPTLNETWDLVFIDADKTGYIDYYELTLPLLKKGGYILADNVLFHGEVLKPELKGKNAKAVHAFNVHVFNDQRVQQVLLTVRDGLLLIKKL